MQRYERIIFLLVNCVTSPLNQCVVWHFTETETNQYFRMQGSIIIVQSKTNSKTVIIVLEKLSSNLPVHCL